ncbi:MAG: 5-phospho-D-xylono,4-lactonase [Thermomicrobiales bacterium]|nr:5-phospho-D-xylono,4-lactonase [Thermomicrobiales bacterium]
MRVSRDETFDYGLAPGERFEPEEEDEERFDLSRPHVMTALGPIEPDDLGFTLPHEHLIRKPLAFGPDDPDLALDDPGRTLAELEDASNLGLCAIVDMTTADSGRDVVDLTWVAQRSPVHVILVTGYHQDRYAAPVLGGASVDEIAERMIRELTDGIDGTTVKAGAIAAGTSMERITPVEDRVLRAAARAHLATGAPISTMTERGTMAVEQIAILREEGVEPSRVIVGHLDAAIGETYLRRVLATGVFVSLDRIGHLADGADAEQASMVRALVAAGYAGQVLLSGDVGRRSRLKAYGGGPGWSYLVEEFPILLMEAGLDAPTVRRLFVDNPSRALTIRR